jgi:serine/threonine protein kinase
VAHGGDPQATAGVREGDVIAGKYRVEKVLGAGGMGVVVAAHHLQLDEKVAIKFLLPETLADPEMVARFAREARAAVKIKSDHVARIIDVGTLDNGAPYTVMEFLDGTDLAARIRNHGPLPIELAVDFVLQASEAVAEAHALGIVHRDLKPANLFVIRRPDGLAIKVLDFGISKLTGSAAASNAAMTRTVGPMGSPLYMSPEQMHSASSVDSRTDIWALGVVLYEALAGVPPFRGSTLPEVCAKILSTAPVPLVRLRPDVPPALDAVVHKCLEKDREVRFRDIAEMAAPLASFGSESARLSLRRICGVLQGGRRPEASTGLTVTPPTDPREVTIAAPAEMSRSPEPAPPALVPPLVGTARPVSNTMATRKARPTRALLWTALGILGVAGAAVAWMIRGPGPGPEPVSASATAAATATLLVGVASSPSLPPPPIASSLSTVPSSSVSAAVSTDVPPAATARNAVPRHRPHADPGPTAVTSTSPIGAPSSAPPKAVVVATATTPNCRLLSSFDTRGREHFNQVCDGN